MDNKKIFSFDFRIQAALLYKLHSFCGQKGYSVTQAVQRAFVYTLAIYRKGLFNYRCSSEFILRGNKQDLERCVVLLSRDVRVILRNLSFTLGKSQAEILRLALECYLYGYENEARVGVREKYEEKLWNANVIYPPSVIIFEAARAKRITYEMLGRPPVYKVKFYNSYDSCRRAA